MIIRFAEYGELERVNELRKQVNELHVKGRPDIFKPGFPEELEAHVYDIFRDPMQKIAVCEEDGVIRAFAVLHHIVKPETPFMFERELLDIDEFCVDESFRRRGAASEMISFIREYALKEGFAKVELNMWEFNKDALAFYEAAGFVTYRRYMELPL